MDKDSLEYKLNFKYRSGQITEEEYNDLLEKFDKLGMLSIKPGKLRKIHVEGSKAIDELIVSGPVIISGGLTVNGAVECNQLSISGSTNIIGHLHVSGKVGISGELHVAEDVKIVGPSSVTGSLRANDRIISTDRLSVTGSIQGEDIIVGDDLRVLGKITGQDIKCTGSINITGSVNAESIIGASFTMATQLSKSDSSHISGDIKAEKVKISTPLKNLNIDLSKLYNLNVNFQKSGIKGLDSFIDTTLNHLLPNVVDKIEKVASEISAGLSSISEMLSSGLTVGGSIIANNINLSHVIVHGDLIADTIKIGPKVVVTGRIIYREHIDIPDDAKYNISRTE